MTNRIIIAQFETNQPEAFSSLKPFFKKYPHMEAYRESINNYLSRKKLPYTKEGWTVYRKTVN